MSLSSVGKSEVRKDLRGKLTGEARYSADLKLPGMLYGQVLRSPHPHAAITSIDTTQAAGLPGVHAIVTPFDSGLGRVAPDMMALDTRVRFVGDEVAAVAASDEDTARHALELIEVQYRTLPFFLEPEEALEAGAAAIHPGGNLVGGRPLSLERGSVAHGFSEADFIVEGEYFVPAHSPASLEPRAALASWEYDGEGDFLTNEVNDGGGAGSEGSVTNKVSDGGREGSEGSITVWKSSRGVHVDRDALAEALSIPPERVRVVGPHLGGGYGSKDESRLAALAAILSQRSGRPVRIEYSRPDEFVAGRTRHAAGIRIRVGAKKDGTITAIHTTAILNTGAYMASGLGVARRLGQGCLYLYHCPNAKYEAQLVYTNRPVAGSYRALGAPQGHFALETIMDRVAEAVGIDPLEFRLKNRVRVEGQPGIRTTPHDQIVDTQPVEGGIPFSSNGLEQCLRLGAEAFGWSFSPLAQPPDASNGVSDGGGERREGSVSKKRGQGLSMLIYRGGPGNPSSAQVRLDKSGKVALVAGLMDVGEGAATVLAQMAAETLGVGYEDVDILFADTAATPDAPITAGSTATFSTGTAVVQAASDLKDKLLELASVGLEAPVDALEVGEGFVWVRNSPSRRMSLADVAGRAEGEEISAFARVMPGSAEYIVNSFGAHFAEVEVDTDTGNIRVLRYVAAHDSGRIINPRAALNQVEGGVSQMLGFTLSEELVTDGPTGITLNGSFLEHKSPTIMDYPDIRVIFADVVDPVGPVGAKALGEPPSVGVAPAIANAIYDAIGIRFTRLPITPDRVLTALAEGLGEAQ